MEPDPALAEVAELSSREDRVCMGWTRDWLRYPVLHRLEEGGLLAGRWVTADSGRRRRVYALTRRGTRELGERRAVWERFSDAIGSLLEGSRPWQNPA